MIEMLVGGVLYFIDRTIKRNVESKMTVGEEHDLGHGHFKLCLHHNYGSAGNMGAGNPKYVKMLSLLLTVLVNALFFFNLFSKKNTEKLSESFGLALLASGALSNTYDRMTRGYVTDYLRIMHGPKWFKRLIWNLADFGIIVGAIISLPDTWQ